MSQKNEHFENFILFLVVGGFVIAGVLYGLFLFWPYFVFYILPFIIGSLLVGITLRFATLPNVAEEGEGVLKYDYIKLAVIYPALIILVFSIFYVGSERTVIIEKNNGGEKIRLEWVRAHKTFNEWRSSIYKNSPFDSLKAKASVPVLYDRQEMGSIAWFCLFFGGPLFFFYLVRHDNEEEEKSINAVLNKRTAEVRRRVDEKNADLNATIESRLQKLREEIKGLECDRAEILRENNILKAKLEYSPDVPRPPESVKTDGVLDRDAF